MNLFKSIRQEFDEFYFSLSMEITKDEQAVFEKAL